MYLVVLGAFYTFFENRAIFTENTRYLRTHIPSAEQSNLNGVSHVISYILTEW